MENVQTNLYEYHELSDAAKEKARDWFLACGLDNDIAWSDTVEDAKQIGLRIDSLDARRTNKGSFIVSAIETMEAILKDHGENCETYKTALAMQKAVDALPELPAEDAEDYDEAESTHCEAIDKIEADFLQSLLEDYRIMFEKDCEYRTSEEYIKDTMEANGYTFLESGKRFG